MKTIALASGLTLLAWNAASSSWVEGAEPLTHPPADTMPAALPDSARTYHVHFAKKAGIQLDGRLTDPAWSRAQVEKHFVFPWKQEKPPPTEFRAIADDRYLYFSYRVTDPDVVVLKNFKDEQDTLVEDRAEMYVSRDAEMKDYYCFEIDPRGHIFDYRARYHGQFDVSWSWKGLEAKGAISTDGYSVEGRITLESFKSLGFGDIGPGSRIRCGLYRAEFSHGGPRKITDEEARHLRGRRLEDGSVPIEAWISWVDPKRPEVDFHVPASLGWLKFDP